MTTHRVRERGLSPTRGRFQDLHLVRAGESAAAASSAPVDAAVPVAADAPADAAHELLQILQDNVRVWAAHSHHPSTQPAVLSLAEEAAAQHSTFAPPQTRDLNVQVAAAQQRLVRWLSQTTPSGRRPATSLPSRYGARLVVLQ